MLALALIALLAGPPPAPAGWLGSAPYIPREGDLIFYDDRKAGWTALFRLAGTGPPLHMGIVVRRSDGRLAVLEAGPDDTLWVASLRVETRLRQFHRDFGGEVVIRRCRRALTARESRALSLFAAAQEGKPYAVLRLLAQGTPFRARGPWPAAPPATHLNRGSWICSELAAAAASVAGLIDPSEVPANTVYPRDLVDDRRFNLGTGYHPAEAWRP
jgi:hypothetical protein